MSNLVSSYDLDALHPEFWKVMNEVTELHSNSSQPPNHSKMDQIHKVSEEHS